MIVIREAVSEDAEAIAQVRVDTWRTTYRGMVPDAHLDSLSYETSTYVWRNILMAEGRQGYTYVAVDENDRVIGFAIGGYDRGGNSDYEGELYAIYLLQSYQGKGIGRRLIAAVARKLVEIGVYSMLVWVLAENPARRFYESLGGVYLSTQKLPVGMSLLDEVSYGWKDIRPLAAVEE